MKTPTKISYSFEDWVTSRRPENGPSDEELDNFPMPPKLVNYRPAWGKGSKSAEKAVSTRNRNSYERAKDTFRREVLPKILKDMDAQSMHSTGLDLQDCELIRQSGYAFYALEDRGSWLSSDDPRIEQALAMNATPITPEEFFNRQSIAR